MPAKPRKGYLKNVSGSLSYRKVRTVCRVRTAGTHAVARYAKLLVIPKPRACVPHTPYKWAGYLKFIFR